ncbi:MAG TPA: hypothetical protein VKZ94_00225 [Advenella sp.]|nr:hypothetical protein [Advenella sp.]
MHSSANVKPPHQARGLYRGAITRETCSAALNRRAAFSPVAQCVGRALVPAARATHPCGLTRWQAQR